MNKIFIFILSLSLFGIACNKDAEIIDDIDGNLNFQQIDSFSLKTKTIIDEAINGKNVSTILLGQTQDNRIGNSKASFYTNFSISKNSFDIGNSPVLDSIVLVFKQEKSYGSLSSSFDIKVYELSSSLLANISYDNNTVLNVKPNPIASITNFKFTSGSTIIRLPLLNSFGNNLLNVFGTDVMESSDNFKAFFKGIYVTATSATGNGLVYLKLKNDNTKMILYYHNDTNTNVNFEYIIKTNDITVNQYIQNNNGSEALSAINNSNEEVGYISSMSGVKTAIEFPDLSTLNGIIINKAELIVYQEDYGNPENILFPEPDKLFLFQNLQDTSIRFLPDFSLNDPTPFGGAKEAIEINGINTNKYTFNITEYIQKLVKNSAETNKLYLTDITNNEGNRLTIGGGKHNSLALKLNIVFTKTN